MAKEAPRLEPTPGYKNMTPEERDKAYAKALVQTMAYLAGVEPNLQEEDAPMPINTNLTDWNALWNELSERRGGGGRGKGRKAKRPDDWAGQAQEFRDKVCNRWKRPDSSRDLIVSAIDADSTVLDIGSGPGSWSMLLAQKAKRVTALDPSPSMLNVLRHVLQEDGIDNIDIIEAAWPADDVPVHDYSLCSHAMYMTPDLPAFVRAMESVTRKQCFLLMRAPLMNGVMAEASRRVYGHPHDSNNALMAYNILAEMGLYVNIQMEDTPAWGGWKHDTKGAALAELKRRLGVPQPCEHDAYFRSLLDERLREVDGQWVWPPSVRSMMLYWDVQR